ncbi:nudC domain-containing protein 3-like [Tropilaelaps mercedesae]|uniref:NudC domain-containing protein 3-like n=1 Tax=Tropilaelaps mercedesae TaxID=418985 RepID=A0A1V9Y2Y5_9ACAR|nr:nudC domain-containing protein 3-like [Tropilaelaps mercedesae]
MDDTKYDGMLLELLSICGRPERFLDVIFGFLYRRSDFYEAASSPQAPRGLPPGYAVKITHMAFQKYYKLAQAEAQKKGLLEPAMKVDDLVPKVARDELVNVSGEQVILQHRGDEIVVQADGVSAKEGTSKFNIGGLQINSSDSFNGADRDNYSWTQTHDDIDVRVKITKSQQKFGVICTGGKRLRVTAFDQDVLVTLVEGDLLHKIKESEMVWTASAGEFIHVSLHEIIRRMLRKKSNNKVLSK